MLIIIKRKLMLLHQDKSKDNTDTKSVDQEMQHPAWFAWFIDFTFLKIQNLF